MTAATTGRGREMRRTAEEAIALARWYWGQALPSYRFGSGLISSGVGGWAERQPWCAPWSFAVGKRVLRGGELVFEEYGRGMCWEGAFEVAFKSGHPAQFVGERPRGLQTFARRHGANRKLVRR